MFAHCQAAIEAAQLGIVARRRLSRFHQQKAQKRTALFADVSQLLPPAAGVLAGNQSKVASHFLARGKPLRRPQSQHHGQRRYRSHSRMRLQPSPPPLAGPLPLPPAGSVARLSASSPSSACSSCASAAGPRKAAISTSPTPPAPLRSMQLALLLHSLAQRHGLQLILHSRPRLHLLVTMHQQLPHVRASRLGTQIRGTGFRNRVSTCSASLRSVSLLAHHRINGSDFIPHPPATARTPTPPAAARTTDSARRPPSPPRTGCPCQRPGN